MSDLTITNSPDPACAVCEGTGLDGAAACSCRLVPPTPTPLQMVREFHEAFELPVRDSVGLPAQDRSDKGGLRELRAALLSEEWNEYVDAEVADDIVEIADALADMVYVIYGTALTYGIDLDAVVAEVHRSNMSKLGEDGKPMRREDGKVLKGPGFFRPDIAAVLSGSGSGVAPDA